MTVYADNMRRYARVDRGSGRVLTGRWSHLMADDPDELAGFAARLGLRPEWVQFPGTPREHYDVVEAVRRRAVAAGAVPISYPDDTGNVIATKRLQAIALDAASRGWHVFPLRPGTKVPAVRHWEHEATTDTEQIKALWTAQLGRRDRWHVPEPPNTGVACGPSGLVVIDLDVEKPGQDRTGWAREWVEYDITSGAEVLAALADLAGGTVPDTYMVATPSGGRHLYFTAPAGLRPRNSIGHPGPLIDVRGDGGYAVAAGSHLHAPARDGSAAEPGTLGYRVVEDRPPAELPVWLANAIATHRHRDHNPTAGQHQIDGSRRQALDIRSDAYAAAALRGEVDRVRSAPVGQRNHTLNAAAYNLGQLVAAGVLDHGRAVEALTAAAESAGLEAAEIGATIDSGLTAGAKRPRATATTSGEVPNTGESRADDPTQPSTYRRPQHHFDAAEDPHSEVPQSIGAEPLDPEQLPATEPGDLNANTTENDRSLHVCGNSAGGPISDTTIDKNSADPADQVAPGPADPEERSRVAQTGPDWTAGTPSARETAADALRVAVHTVAEASNSGNGSVAGEEVDQLTDAAYAALEAWTEPPEEAGASEPASDERRQVEPRKDKSRLAAIPEEPADAHAALDQAIKHARAAVTHLEATRAATRRQSRADAPDAAVGPGRPAYWAETEVDL